MQTLETTSVIFLYTDTIGRHLRRFQLLIIFIFLNLNSFNFINLKKNK